MGLEKTVLNQVTLGPAQQSWIRYESENTHFCTLTPTPTTLWGTKTKPGTGMPPPRTETIAEPTETIAKTRKQLGTQH